MTRLVIHADDVGMCHGANRAFVELSHAGTITSGSVMVPCPWFPELAEVAAADASLDVGVHLTLNAEKAHYRWRPVSNASAASGLVDDDGYLWHRVAQVRQAAHPDAVEEEWRAQIDQALLAGIDVTHLDTHMGSALAPEWCERYVAIGVEYRLPVLITSTLALTRRTTTWPGFRRRNSRISLSRRTRPGCRFSTWCWRQTSAAQNNIRSIIELFSTRPLGTWRSVRFTRMPLARSKSSNRPRATCAPTSTNCSAVAIGTRGCRSNPSSCATCARYATPTVRTQPHERLAVSMRSANDARTKLESL